MVLGLYSQDNFRSENWSTGPQGRWVGCLHSGTVQTEANKDAKLLWVYFFLLRPLLIIPFLWSSLTTIWLSLLETPSQAQKALARSPAPEISLVGATGHWTQASPLEPQLAAGRMSCRTSSASNQTNFRVDYCRYWAGSDHECWCGFHRPLGALGKCICPWWLICQW